LNSKPKIGILTFIAFLLLISAGCDPSSKDKMEYYDNTKGIDLSDENVNSISLYSNENNVINAFGKPIEITETTNPMSKHLAYNGIEFEVIQDKVIRYFFKENYQTSKGIRVGDTKNEVVTTYSENYYERNDTGSEIIGYFDKDNMINIEFAFEKNKVEGVIIEKVGWRENN
jgi:hypothetical protein